MKPLCVVSCPIDTFSGYGARSRDFVKGLIQSKGEEWDIKIMPQRWGDCPWNFLSLDDSLRQRFIGNLDPNHQPDIWVQITVPNEFQPVGKFNIGVSAGIETTIYPGEFIEGSNRMDLNLVSSKHSKDVALFTSFDKKDSNTNQIVGTVKLEKPIEVLFEGLDLDKYNKKPALILKTNHINYSLIDKEEILKKINQIKDKMEDNLPNIYLLHGEMTDDEMNQLNNDNKVKAFVSFTKGEGYGRPLVEAAITGKPVITSNWSGHLDFLHPDYNVLIGGELKNIHEDTANQFLLKDSQWFSINIEIASRAMKDIVKHYKRYFENSRKQTQYLKNNFSFNKMVEKINEFMPEIEAAPQTQTLNLPKLKKVEKKINLNELT